MALDYRGEYQRYKKYYTYLGSLGSQPVVRAYFSLVASILTIAIFMAFAIRPTIATIIGLRKEIADKRELVVRLDDKINALSALQIEYRQVESSLSQVLSAIPEGPEVGSMVGLLEKTEAAAGLPVGGITASEINYSATASKAAEVIPLTVAIPGQYENVLSFLAQLKTSPRIFSISGMLFDNSNTDKGLTTRLTVKTYFWP